MDGKLKISIMFGSVIDLLSYCSVALSTEYNRLFLLHLVALLLILILNFQEGELKGKKICNTAVRNGCLLY